MKSFKKFIVTAALLIAGTVNAACITNDAWTGPDKNRHFVAGAAIGSVTTLVFKEPKYGFIAGTLAGAFIEIRDARGAGVCSYQDFAVTALGAAAGAYGTAWIVTPNFVGFAKKF